MELYKELLINALQSQKIEMSFPDIKVDAEKIIKLKCYDALKQIKEVIDDDALEDIECFESLTDDYMSSVCCVQYIFMIKSNYNVTFHVFQSII